MKNKIVLDFSVFNSVLRELKAIRKELRALKGEPEKRPVPRRNLSDGITTKEVLKILKVTPATLNNYEKHGLLKYHVEGRSKIYSESEVRSFRKTRGRRKRLSKSLLNKVKSTGA